MGPLDDLTGHNITLNDVPLPDRKRLIILGDGITATDSDPDRSTTLNFGGLSGGSVGDGSVTTPKLANGAVTAAKLDAHAGAYATYSALRLALVAGEAAAGDTVKVASRAMPGDGGYGEFYVVAIGSNVDNGGTILTGGSLAALRKIIDFVTPEQFGSTRYATRALAIAGGADSAAAINAALAASKSVYLSGWYCIGSKITIPEGAKLYGRGYVNTSTLAGGASGIVKLPFNDDAILMSGGCSQLVDLTVHFATDVTNDNDGVVCTSNNLYVGRVTVSKATRDGFRIGVDGSTSNVNSSHFDCIEATECDRDGIHVHANTAGVPDVNAIQFTKPFSRHNGRYGFHSGNAWLNTITSPLFEGNTSYGFYCTSQTQWLDIFGGDIEGNGGADGDGQVFFEPGAREVRIISGQYEEPATLPDGDTSPRVSSRKFVVCAQTAATTITTFDNAAKGVDMIVRLDGYTTIQPSATLTTRDGKPITGDASALVQFRNVNGVWVEAWRSQALGRVYQPQDSGRVASWAAGDDYAATITAGSPSVYDAIPERGAYRQGTAAGFTATSTNRPDVGAYYGKSAPLFNATGKRLQSTLSPEYYRCLHNPDSSLLFSIRFQIDSSVAGTNYVCSTAPYSNTEAGFGLINLSGTLYLYVANGSGGATPLGVLSAGPAIAADTDYTVVVAKTRSELVWWVNDTFQAAVTLTSPTRSNPSHSLILGNRSGGGGHLDGPIYEFAMHLMTPDVYDGAQMANYLLRWS
jgi:hypothetical protein